MASTLNGSREPNLRRGRTIDRLPLGPLGFRGPRQPLVLDLINSLFKLAGGSFGVGFLR